MIEVEYHVMNDSRYVGEFDNKDKAIKVAKATQSEVVEATTKTEWLGQTSGAPDPRTSYHTIADFRVFARPEWTKHEGFEFDELSLRKTTS